MATDFSQRPKPAVLKRFANLDIDGVVKPARRTPARLGSPEQKREDRSEQGLERFAEDLNQNARMAREGRPERTRFTAPMTSGPASTRRVERQAELRGMRPPDPVVAPPAPSRGSPITTRLAFDARPWDGTSMSSSTRNEIARLTRAELDDIAGLTPGVVTVEVDRRAPSGTDFARRPRRDARMAQPESTTPIELTPMAARQVQLMAWEAGVPGSGLRILTSSQPGLERPEIDFAFDDHVEADDLVFECHGVTLLVDPGSLRSVIGRRITWHDVPGSEGFSVR